MTAPRSIRLAVPFGWLAAPPRRLPAAWFGVPAAGSLAPCLKVHSRGGSTMSTNAPEVRKEDRPGLERLSDRYEAVRQYSLAQILGVWAAAAVPMGVLAWIVAPLLSHQLGGDQPLAQALLICITAGLIWQFVLTVILVRRELGGLEWSRVRDALWLRRPRDPKTGRLGGKAWWWLVPLVLLFGVWSLVPAIPAVGSPRNFGEFLGNSAGED